MKALQIAIAEEQNFKQELEITWKPLDKTSKQL